jgi:hypothetical protein
VAPTIKASPDNGWRCHASGHSTQALGVTDTSMVSQVIDRLSNFSQQASSCRAPPPAVRRASQTFRDTIELERHEAILAKLIGRPHRRAT